MIPCLGPIDGHPICKGVGHLPVKIFKKHAFSAIFSKPKKDRNKGDFLHTKKLNKGGTGRIIDWMVGLINLDVYMKDSSRT